MVEPASNLVDSNGTNIFQKFFGEENCRMWHPHNGADVREDVFKLAADKGWTLREMRREVASLEDFFVKITAEQRGAGV